MEAVPRGDRRWCSRSRDRFQFAPGTWTPVPGSCPVLSPGRLFPGSLFHLRELLRRHSQMLQWTLLEAN